MILGRRAARRGATLIEILVALGIVVLIAGSMFIGIGVVRQARLREASTLVASAVRVAYVHANASSRVTRLVFDFAKRSIEMQDSDGVLFIENNRTGGAAGATEVEKQAIDEGEKIIDGPKKKRPEFHAVRAGEIDAVARARENENDDGKKARRGTGKELPRGVFFRQIEVAHEDAPVTSEQVYLYFWPGGQAERAAVQVELGQQAQGSDVMTVSVAPLTGQVAIANGPVEIKRPLTDEEASDR